MAHKCFISFKMEDLAYKEHIQNHLAIEMIDNSLNEQIDSNDFDYVMRKIREDYLSDSTVTIHLIGARSGEWLGLEEQKYIKSELQASLYNGQGNTKSGVLGVVLPSMTASIYGGAYICPTCGNSHYSVRVHDNTVTEFSYNYHIPNGKCAWAEEDRYCVLVNWDDFIADPETFVDRAFDKRASPISDKTKVRP